MKLQYVHTLSRFLLRENFLECILVVNMKKLLPLLRLSAKEYCKDIKKKNIFSHTLDARVFIARSFYLHITKKPRDIRDMAERLAMFPLIPKILVNGFMSSSDDKYIKISYQVNEKLLLSCIVYKEKNETLSLISCFQDFHVHKKSNLS